VNQYVSPKLIGIIIAMLVLSGVFFAGRLSESGYIGLMGLLVGYLVGNGIAAAQNDPVQPAIGHHTRFEEDHHHDQ
jgi:hypothetical protein